MLHRTEAKKSDLDIFSHPFFLFTVTGAQVGCCCTPDRWGRCPGHRQLSWKCQTPENDFSSIVFNIKCIQFMERSVCPLINETMNYKTEHTHSPLLPPWHHRWCCLSCGSWCTSQTRTAPRSSRRCRTPLPVRWRSPPASWRWTAVSPESNDAQHFDFSPLMVLTFIVSFTWSR